MTTHRGAYIAIFVVASLVAAGVYYLGQPRTEVVRARADIAALTPISTDMVELVAVGPGRPADTATALDEVIGQYAAMPILAGQLVDQRALESTPGAQAFGFGAPLPPRHVAFALPVEPAQALGGALRPGALVDVVAAPNALRTLPADAAADAPQAVVLGQGLTVLALRSVEGQTLTEGAADAERATALPPRLGSVVVAIPAAELPDYAGAVLSSTVYLALSPTSPDGDAATP